MDDSDEAVAEGAPRLVVGVAIGGPGVVVGPGAGVGGEGDEGLQVQRVAGRLFVACSYLSRFATCPTLAVSTAT